MNELALQDGGLPLPALSVQKGWGLEWEAGWRGWRSTLLG